MTVVGLSLSDRCDIVRQTVDETTIDAAGVPVDVGAEVVTADVPCRVKHSGTGSGNLAAESGVVSSNAAFVLLPDVDIVVTDVIRYGGIDYRIASVNRPVDFYGNVDHTRVDAIRTTR